MMFDIFYLIRPIVSLLVPVVRLPKADRERVHFMWLFARNLLASGTCSIVDCVHSQATHTSSAELSPLQKPFATEKLRANCLVQLSY